MKVMQNILVSETLNILTTPPESPRRSSLTGCRSVFVVGVASPYLTGRRPSQFAAQSLSSSLAVRRSLTAGFFIFGVASPFFTGRRSVFVVGVASLFLTGRRPSQFAAPSLSSSLAVHALSPFAGFSVFVVASPLLTGCRPSPFVRVSVHCCSSR
ncbi:hypothetical protein PIB30_061391 [Stylosanthes scabra]|uniref:Transmembrane protein n=1 Tax=Stylosanthes scabra TaxID=79078 RepID=A0ABU6QML4_9FABA|nr:hypothetical protein [Stylosanthes scabra]